MEHATGMGLQRLSKLWPEANCGRGEVDPEEGSFATWERVKRHGGAWFM